MIKAGVLPFNAIVSCFYLILGALSLVVLKKSSKGVTRFERANSSPSQWFKQDTNYNKMFAISWLKKYTIAGSFFLEDKKYLLKQFFFIAAYGVSCLGINKLIIWPVAFSSFLLPVSFLIWDLLFKKLEAKNKEVGESNFSIANHQQPQSQLNIQPSNVIEPTITVLRPSKAQEQAKINTKSPRGIIQRIILSAFCFGSLVMMMQTVLTIGTSVSNSGQLNIISLLLIFIIDQLAFRLAAGLLLWATLKAFVKIVQINQQESSLFCLLCFEDITETLIQQEKQRIKRATAMTASPPRKKTDSPSKVPKAIASKEEKQTYLNLINLQPTKRQGEQPLQEIYLTTAEKDLFEQNNKGYYTKRNRNRQNKDHISFSAQKGTTIDYQDKKQNDDILILKDDPFDDIENHASGIRNTKRRGMQRRKNRRNLQLTGTSPYLQYLPDMLKKVDKFKSGKEKEKKVL